MITTLTCSLLHQVSHPGVARAREAGQGGEGQGAWRHPDGPARPAGGGKGERAVAADPGGGRPGQVVHTQRVEHDEVHDDADHRHPHPAATRTAGVHLRGSKVTSGMLVCIPALRDNTASLLSRVHILI